MELSELKRKLESLRGVVFLWEKRPYQVENVKYDVSGRFIVFTDQRTFMHEYQHRFEAWLSEITLLDETAQKKEFKPNNKQIMDAEVTAAIQTAANGTKTLTDGLMKAFQDIANDPSDQNIKKGVAMSGIANTMVNVGKLQLDFLKVKKGE